MGLGGRAIAALGLLLALPVTGRAADPFAACDAALAERPQEFQSAKCFYEVAREANLWQEARRQLEARIADHPDLPWLRFYQGSVAMQLGEADAETLFGDAARVFAERGDAAGETYSRINRSRLLEGDGRTEDALDEAGRARRAAAAGDQPQLLLEVRMLELRLRYLVGDERVGVRRDLERLDRALSEESSYALRRDVANHLGALAYELGEDDAALDRYARVAELARQAGDPPTVAAAELNVLRVTLARSVGPGWRGEAVQRAEAVLAAARDAGVPAIEAAALISLGRLDRGAAGEARLEEALVLARRLDDAGLVRDALAFLAHRALDRPDRALALADESLAAARRVSDPLGPATRWLQQLEVRWQALGAEAALAHADQIFDSLEAASRAESEDTARARLFAVWAEAYYWVAGRLFREHVKRGEPDLLAAGFRVLERMRARLLMPAEDGAPNAILGLHQVERSLAPNEAVLAFQLVRDRDVWGHAAGGAWVVVTTRAGSSLFPLPDLDAFEPRVAMLLSLLERRDGAGDRAGRALHAALLDEPLASLPLAVERLHLIPDGPLHRLPFAALTDAAGRPLGDRYELSRIPSATVWRRLAALHEPAPGAGVVAIVDTLGDGDASPARSWLPEDAEPLGPLVFARREARALRRSFGAACRVLSGPAAAEAAVRADLPGVRLAHFATHALVDTRSPERSAVVLAAGPPGDGLLTAPEIAALGLAGPLVVLSTCESAAGPLLRGEGTMSLARAFFRGGARTVVASLWRLRDREAAALFERFYLHLGRGASVTAALQVAQRDRRAAGDPARAWAGLTVIGDGAWVPVPAGSIPAARRPSGVLVAGIVAVVALLAAWLSFRIFGRRRSAS